MQLGLENISRPAWMIWFRNKNITYLLESCIDGIIKESSYAEGRGFNPQVTGAQKSEFKPWQQKLAGW